MSTGKLARAATDPRHLRPQGSRGQCQRDAATSTACFLSQHSPVAATAPTPEKQPDGDPVASCGSDRPSAVAR